MDKFIADSKTVWFGFITCMVAVGSFIQDHEFVKEYPAVVSSIGVIVGILIIVLRFLSTEAVTVFKKKP